jgi:hypothetical protein
MISFIRKPGIRASQLKLVSLHIPKTAGTSFRNILKEVYGEEHVVRFDINQKVLINNEEFNGRKLDADISVIHGHFQYSELMKRVRLPDNVPVITWLRHPVERVISNYFYLEKILREELDEEKKGLNILAKMQKTLREYAATEANRNRMSKFLEGADPARLFFTGIVEHYEEDLAALSSLLGWQEYPMLKHNVTGDRPDVDLKTVEFIRELNEKDCDLYEKALQLRSERINPAL